MEQARLDGIPDNYPLLFSYPGSKRRLLPVLMPIIAKTRATEIACPFLGGGSVEMRCMSYGIRVLANDLYEPLVNFWRQAQDNRAELMEKLALYCHLDKGVVNGIRAIYLYGADGGPDKLSDALRAAHFFICILAGYGSRPFNLSLIHI